MSGYIDEIENELERKVAMIDCILCNEMHNYKMSNDLNKVYLPRSAYYNQFIITHGVLGYYVLIDSGVDIDELARGINTVTGHAARRIRNGLEMLDFQRCFDAIYHTLIKKIPYDRIAEAYKRFENRIVMAQIHIGLNSILDNINEVAYGKRNRYRRTSKTN